MIWKIKEFFKSLSNFWKFRKEIWKFRPYDYEFNIKLFRKSLELTRDNVIKYSSGVFKQKEIIDPINQFLELTNDKDFTDVSEEYDNYISNLDFSFEETDKKEHFNLKFNNSSNVSEERAEQLTRRELIWQKARWNRAWKIVKDNMQGWWN